MVEVDVPINQSEDIREIEEDEEVIVLTPADRNSRQIDLGGRDPKAVWEVMKQHAANIHDANFDYNAGILAQNSNSTIVSVLNSVGLNFNDNLPVSKSRDDFPGANNLLFLATNLEGTDQGDLIQGYKNKDTLNGAAGNDSLKGGAGNDVLSGGAGNDLLDGEEGNRDIAVFTEEYTVENYPYLEGIDGTISFVNDIDGIDTLKNIEWAQFSDRINNLDGTGGGEERNIARRSTNEPETVTRIIPLPLSDGVEETVSEEVYVEPPVGFAPDPVTPPHVSLTAPIAMLDGDVDFTLNISPYEPNVDRNITYIIDTSYSMLDRGNLEPTKDAYTDLTNYFIDNELAENTNFNIIQFSRYANSYSNLSAEQAISTIQNLVTAPARDGTKYNDALYQGFNRFAQSAATDATDIAYFVADGKSQTNFFDPNDVSYTGDAQLLRAVANVQAFGISDAPFEPGAVTTGQINFVDSNQGVIVDDVANLSSELQKSGLAGSVESVNILLDGEIVETVTPNQLTDTPLGLIYEGSVDELDVSIGAENIITTEVVFTPVSNLENTIVEHSVAVGEGEIVDENGNVIDESGGTGGDGSGDGDEDDNPFERRRNGSAGADRITLGYADLGANGGDGSDQIIGNARSNILNGGAGNDTISAHGGDDRITTGSGDDKVDGGEGVDTVIYEDVVYQNNDNVELRQVANTVSYNNTDSLSNIEYIQFADVKVSAETLSIVPNLEISNDTVTEGSADSYSFELNAPTPVDVVFDYSTVDGDAVADSDYTAASGTITIPAGETTAELDIEVLADNLYDEATESLGINITGLTGATFTDNFTESTIPVYIENKGRDEPKTLNGGAGNNIFNGGSGNDSLNGNGGNDILRGNDGDDTLKGGTGSDRLWGQNEDDNLSGQEGNDTIHGGIGSDRLLEYGNVDYKLTNTQLTGLGTDSLSNIELVRLEGGNGDNVIDAIDVTQMNVTLSGVDGNDSMVGGSKSDFLIGGNGNDTVKGRQGNDGVYGQNGNDNLSGQDGDDTLNGGGGYDRLLEYGNVDYKLTNTQLTGLGTDTIGNIEAVRLQGGNNDNVIDAMDVTEMNVTLSGVDGNDSMIGGAKSDFLIGGNGNDTIKGNEGNDGIYGQNGSDNLIGADGNDTLNGGGGGDRITEFGNVDYKLTNSALTGKGSDSIYSVESAYLVGGSGNNTIDAGDTTDIKVTLDGGVGHDSVIGGAKSDFLIGRDGNDMIKGGAGNDGIYGQNGNDNLSGQNGNDTLNGGAGNDRLIETANVNFRLTDTQLTGLGTDTIGNIEQARLEGGAGDNKIHAGQVNNLNVTLVGGAGHDSLYGGAKSDVLYGQDGNDRLESRKGNDILYGSNGNDAMFAGDGVDTLFGGNGADILRGEGGNDILDGGAGSDRIVETANVNFTLTDTQLIGLGTDLIRNVELARLAGGAGNNIIDASSATNIQTIIVGDAGNDTLMGSQMSDNIYGGTGNDVLIGELGKDTLVGNGGADIFALKSAMGADTINDFQNGVDRFGLSASLGFDDLSISNNQAGTATLIADTTNSNELLAIVNNFDAADITPADFVNI